MFVRLLGRKIASFLQQPLWTRMWFGPAWLLLGVGKIAILILPFRRIAPRFGAPIGSHPWIPLATPRQQMRALQIGGAVRLAARYTPWESDCFPQAMAARVLLGLHGIPYVMFFGVRRDPASPAMDAHAWITTGRVSVTGGGSFGHFTVVGCFVAPWLAAAVEP